MFKQRLLTTLILVPLVLMAIYYANLSTLAGLVFLLVALLGWEWGALIPINNKLLRCLFIVTLVLLIWPALHWLNQWLVADLALWGLIFLAVMTFPRSQDIWGNRAIVGGACLLLLPTMVGAMYLLYQQEHGKDLIVYVLCLVWATDIGAYLAGKRWGRIKLIPSVSPGKTIEGSLGGCVFVFLIAGLAALYFQPVHLLSWFVVALFTALISMLGDLFISMLKRRSGVKDTGHIIPGHGGVLDRLDSLIAALPLFFFAQIMNWQG